MAETSLSDVVKRLKQEGQLTRNSGTNSIKTIKEILLESQKASLSDKEDARENAVRQERQLTLLQDIANNGGGVGAGLGDSPAAAAGGGGFLGGMLGGIGLGGGALAAGIGIMAAGGGYLLNQIGEMDADKIVENVKSLLSIGDSFTGGNWGFLVEGGAFGLAMTGIGVGLAAFSIGQGAAAAVDYFAGESNFAENIKSRVKTLLSIKDELGGNIKMLYNGAAFGLAMTGIGLGLAVFGAGSAVAGAADGLAQFVKAEDWAQNIKDRVITLMSISDELGGAASFITGSAVFLPAMAGIAAGLAVFGAGAAAGAGGTAIADGLTLFTGEGDFAKTIKARVKTLMSIKDELGGTAAAFGESGTFLAVMTGIGAGLAVFGAGSAVTGAAEGLSKFTGEADWAQTVKDRVKTLVSITDELSDGDGPTSKAGLFTAGMAKISAGLIAFGGANLIGTLANAGTAILDFFGVNNPFDQIMQIAEKSDQLIQGGNALEKITSALSAFSRIEVSQNEVDFEKMAKNLGAAVPLLDVVANGGTYDPGWLSWEFSLEKGLLDPSIRIDEMAEAIRKVNEILGFGPANTVMATPSGANIGTSSAISGAQAGVNAATDAELVGQGAANATVGVDASTTVTQTAESVYLESDMSARNRDPWANVDYGALVASGNYGG
jgi:hypothetical protein